MSRTYTFNATALYGGRGPRNMYLQGFSAWATKRVGWFKDGSTDYAGAVSIYFDLSSVYGKTIESIILSPSCSGTFQWAVPVLYNVKSTASTTDWSIPNYATEVQCERGGVIPQLDVTQFGLPEHYAYVLGGYYRTYSYVDVTAATLTVVTAETSKTVTYNGNGGSGVPSATTLWGEGEWDGYLSTTVPTRLGYRFDGWNTQANGGGTQYASGSYISITENTVLYAQWTALSSVLDSASNANITETTTVQWTNYGTFTNKLRFIFGSVDSGEISVSGTSYQYTLPSSWYAQIPTSTSGTATVYLYTYVNGTLIGTSSRTFTAYVKSTVVPSINNPTATAVNAKWGLYLQKYSSVKIGVTGGAAGTGASIKSYSITGPGINYSTQTTGSSASATSDIFSTSGTKTYIVTITDSRGRTASKSVSVSVTAYSEPAISSVVGVRCDSDGTINPTTGTSIRAVATFAYAAVGSNTLTRTLEYKKHTASTYTTAQTGITYGTAYVIAVGLAETASSYDVRVVIEDSLGNSASYVTVVPPVAGIAFGLKNDRARFGGPVEKAGLQVDWDAEFNGVVDVTPRRCYAILSNEGWYRVCAISFNSYDEAIGALGGILRFAIADTYASYPNDAHTIDLLLAHNKVTFVAEQSAANGYLEIDKIRYAFTGTSPYYGYVDIHFLGRGGTTYVGISFEYTVVGLDRQARAVAQNLQSVAPSPSGETVLTEYTFAANTYYHDDNVTSGVRHIVDRRGDIVTVTIESAGTGINCPVGQYTTVYTLPSELSPAGSVYTIVDAYGGNNIISGIIDTSGNVQLYPVLSSTSYYRFTLTYTI